MPQHEVQQVSLSKEHAAIFHKTAWDAATGAKIPHHAILNKLSAAYPTLPPTAYEREGELQILYHHLNTHPIDRHGPKNLPIVQAFIAGSLAERKKQAATYTPDDESPLSSFAKIVYAVNYKQPLEVDLAYADAMEKEQERKYALTQLERKTIQETQRADAAEEKILFLTKTIEELQQLAMPSSQTNAETPQKSTPEQDREKAKIIEIQTTYGWNVSVIPSEALDESATLIKHRHNFPWVNDDRLYYYEGLDDFSGGRYLYAIQLLHRRKPIGIKLFEQDMDTQKNVSLGFENAVDAKDKTSPNEQPPDKVVVSLPVILHVERPSYRFITSHKPVDAYLLVEEDHANYPPVFHTTVTPITNVHLKPEYTQEAFPALSPVWPDTELNPMQDPEYFI